MIRKRIMFVDSHAHFLNEYYSELEIKEIIGKMKQSKVDIVVNCATSFENFDEIISFSNNSSFYYALGIHPEEIEDFDSDDFNKLNNIILEKLNDKKFVAIGEIGLDFYHRIDNKEKQIKIFKHQLDLASKYNLPVLIHSREATKEVIDILKNYQLKGIIHCYSGSLETAKEYIKLGYKLGIGGVITFKNCNLKNIIKEIGINNIVLETDCPFMTPEPYRKFKNDPSYIPVIAKYLSDIFDFSIEEVRNITTENCMQIFDFNK